MNILKVLLSGRKRRWMVLVALVVAVLIGAFGFRPSPPPVIILPVTTPVSSQQVSFLDRSIPPTWGWLWRLRYALFGSPRPITIGTTIVDLAGEDKEWESTLGLRPTFADTNGLRVWIIDATRLETLRQEWTLERRIVSSPRAITAHGMGISQSMKSTVQIGGANREAGVYMEFMPRVTPKVADLTASFRMTEAVTDESGAPTLIRTNLAVVARFQIPEGKGVLLLSDNFEPGRPNYGILLSANIGSKK